MGRKELFFWGGGPCKRQYRGGRVERNKLHGEEEEENKTFPSISFLLSFLLLSTHAGGGGDIWKGILQYFCSLLLPKMFDKGYFFFNTTQ